MSTRREAVSAFLHKYAQADLAELYTPSMELQVNVAPDGGERTEGTFNNINWVGYTDGIETWKSFRIPFGDGSYEDSPLSFSPDRFEAVGMSGWDWENKTSRWVGFDFDAILGHKKGLRESELDEIRQAVANVDWVTIRRSSSGNGLHLYVFVDVPTETRAEHAALARAILGKLSGEVFQDLQAQVDTCGGNLWVWSRKALKSDGRGFTLIKQGSVLEDIPHNWRDHIPVVQGKRQRVRHAPINSLDVSQDFDSLVNQKTNVKLDEEHKALLIWLRDTDCFHWWDPEAYMLVTHTRHLKEAHSSLGLRGVFETVSEARNLNEQNCFCYPLPRGGWSVRRYTPGTPEAESWTQDSKGWTRCFFNVEPDFGTVCRVNGGLEDEKGGFSYDDVAQAQKALAGMGIEFKLPNLQRQVEILEHPKQPGKVIIRTPKEKSDSPGVFTGWLPKAKHWIKVFNTTLHLGKIETEVDASYDELIRHMTTENGDNAGWVIKSNDVWVFEPMQHVKAALEAKGLAAGEVKNVIGTSVLKPWRLVVQPFGPEYPGGRVWNKSGPQLKYKPRLDQDLVFPHWKAVFQHVGDNLTPYILGDEWCQEHNIRSGEDYLMMWVACLVKHPFDPLPYLFIYGEAQATGKSTFHEALSTLFEPGFQFAEAAITNSSGFNGELEGAVLCVIEERDLSGNLAAYNRIKDWVTSPKMSIHHKRCTPFMAPNTTHWIHVCNDRSFCPVFPGDTRITMVNVNQPPKQSIPKRDLLKLLDLEASDFLGSLVQMKIPDSGERLRVPVIKTGDKQVAVETNMTPLARFLSTCFYEPGAYVSCDTFYDEFMSTLEPADRIKWSRIAVVKHMPSCHPYGLADGVSCWGNLTLPKVDKRKLGDKVLISVQSILTEKQ